MIKLKIQNKLKIKIVNIKNLLSSTPLHLYTAWLMRCVTFALVFLCFSPLVYKAFAQDKIVAIVNNEVITQKDLTDFENFMRMQLSAESQGQDLENKIQSMKDELVNKLIEDRLIIFEAKKNDIKIDDNRIKAKINDIKKHYASDTEFQESLKIQGMAQADLESRIKEQMLMYGVIDRQIRSKISISPADITAYYQNNLDQFKSPKEWDIETIAIASAELASGIYEIIKGGKSFEVVAKENSLVINKINVNEGQFKQDLERLFSSLKPQEISEPVKIEKKYYIFKMNKVVPGRQRSLDESMDTIYNSLYETRMQEEISRWLDELKEKAYIKIVQD